MPAPEQPAWPWGSGIVTTTVLGHPCRSYEPRRTHVADLLEDARRFPDRDYLVQGGRRMTFVEHEAAVRRATGALVDGGVRPGDRVLLLGRNSLEWVVAFWAIVHAEAIVVLGNAWWSDDELSHALTTSRPELVLADERYVDTLPEDQRRLTLGELAAAGETTTGRPSVRAQEDDPVIVLFTSGTTGLPKGAVLTHRGVLSTLHALLERTNRLPQPDSEPAPPSKALLCLPLFHIGGLQQIITPVVTGGTLVFTEGRFDPAAVRQLIQTEEIRVWSAVPTMVRRVIDHLEDGGLPPITELRTVGMGGSPVGEELRGKVLDWFPNAVRGLAVTYGLSEATGVVSTGAGQEVAARPGTVGKPLAISEVAIESPDETGAGEILVRSPAVMLGYWTADPAAPSGGSIDPGPVTADRWLRTGDVGRLDEDGFLYITDRSKDIVIRGGENIAGPHIEDRLLQHPAVRECAVVGLPHPTLGEEVGAVIVLHPEGQVTEGELAAFAAGTLAYFEIPSRWRFQKEPLPQNSTGKVLKRVVRDAWLDALSSAVK